jgi:hypothetical protein
LKPTTVPTTVFNVKEAFPQQGLEEKGCQVAFTQRPELLVLKIYPPPVKVLLSVQSAEKIALIPAIVEETFILFTVGDAQGFHVSSPVEFELSIRVEV